MYYIYAVSVHVDVQKEKEWLEWMIQVHIPDVLKTGCFSHAKIYKVEPSESGSAVYSIQYRYESIKDFEHYERSYADSLRREHQVKFGSHCLAFRSHAQLIHAFTPEKN